MNITLAVQCCHFQKRCCWQMSSIIESISHSINKPRNFTGRLVLDIASLVNEGKPTTEDVVGLFSEFQDYISNFTLIHRTYTDLYRFSHRGFTRNDQVKDCTTEWIMFCDVDQLYSPMFFPMLEQEIDTNWNKCDGVLSAGRTSCSLESSELIINDIKFPQIIPNAYHEFENSVDGKYQCRNVCAGFHQMIRTELCNGYYVPEDKCGDRNLLEKGQLIRSDRQFRNRFNKYKLPDWFSKNQIHAQHRRDGGNHIVEQR